MKGRVVMLAVWLVANSIAAAVIADKIRHEHAQVIEAATAGETTKIGLTEGESAVPERNAP